MTKNMFRFRVNSEPQQGHCSSWCRTCRIKFSRKTGPVKMCMFCFLKDSRKTFTTVKLTCSNEHQQNEAVGKTRSRHHSFVEASVK